MRIISDRYLKTSIQIDALKDFKMAFISGPRQVGKSTLAKSLLLTEENYFSWDRSVFRKVWVKDPERAIEGCSEGPIVLDEIHKDRRWKLRLKGLYDHQGDHQKILVTGSTRLDQYRRGSDSLLGRYIPYRLHPFSVAESALPANPQDIFVQKKVSFAWADLLQLGGFPEPLLAGSENKARRWSRLRIERILTEDSRDVRNVSDLEALKVLTDLLPECVGSLLSINSLREDIGVAYATVRAWIFLLESLYFGFFVRPFSGKIRRMVRSEPKFYLFDILPIESLAKRQENLAALHLLKACDYWTDTAQGHFELHFLRNKDMEEVDFCVVKNGKPWMLIECKSGSLTPAKSLIKFSKLYGTEYNFQLVVGTNFFKIYRDVNVKVVDYESFFAGLL